MKLEKIFKDALRAGHMSRERGPDGDWIYRLTPAGERALHDYESLSKRGGRDG